MPVVIPEYFKNKAIRQFGPDGEPWVESLPGILTWCEESWGLRDCRPVEGLSINLVCLAECDAYRKVVLKIEGPHGERYTEMAALEAYGGGRACALLHCDRSRGAMLLERLVPGTTLRSLPDPEEQLRIGTEVMASLPVPPPEGNGFPSYQDWLTKAFANMHRDYSPDATMRRLMERAQELYTECTAGATPSVLLHGDLHHDNILRDGDAGWKVIDPQGVIGARFLECGRFLENHLLPEGQLPDLDEAARVVSYVAEGLGESRRRIASAFFILHLLAICWGFEMSYTQEELRLGSRQCELLSGLVGAI